MEWYQEHLVLGLRQLVLFSSDNSWQLNPTRDSCSVCSLDNCFIRRSNYSFTVQCQTERIKSIPGKGECSLCSGPRLNHKSWLTLTHVSLESQMLHFNRPAPTGFLASFPSCCSLQMDSWKHMKGKILCEGHCLGLQGNTGALNGQRCCCHTPPVALLTTMSLKSDVNAISSMQRPKQWQQTARKQALSPPERSESLSQERTHLATKHVTLPSPPKGKTHQTKSAPERGKIL